MKRQLAVLFCLTVLPGPAVAREAAGEAPALMDEVVVTAGRVPEEASSVSAALTVIDRAEIESSAARNVGDLLGEQGLGAIRKYPGALTSVSIRGFRTDTHGNDLQGHVLVLLDGRRAGTGNLAKILTDNVERIEIIRGPGAVQYGSAGLGGVINVITRRGQETTAFARGGGGSFDSWELAAGGTAASGGLDFAASLSRRGSGDYDTGGGAAFANTGVDSETGLSLNLGYTLSPGHRFGVIFTGYAADGAGTPGYLSQPDLDDDADKSNYSVDFRYDGAGDGKCRWMARYFFGRDDNTWHDPLVSNPDGWDDGLDSRNTTDQQGAQIQFTATGGPLHLTLGGDWLDYDVENSWTPKRTSMTNPALFFLGRAELLGGLLSLDAGLRHDWYSIEIEDPAGRDEEDSHLSPQVGLSWKMSDRMRLRARYAQGFMMPSADQLGADYNSWGSRIVGNPALDPEKNDTWEVGLDYVTPLLTGSLTWFSSDYDDKITTIFLADGTQSWQNMGSASIDGIEVSLNGDLGGILGWTWELRPYFTMTLLTTCEDDETGQDLRYLSGTSWAAGVSVGDGEGFTGRFHLSYTGGQDVEDWQSGEYPAPLVRLNSFLVADLTAAWTVYRDERLGNLTLLGEIRNLFDEDYAWVKGYPMPGRSFYVGLRWEY